MGTDVAYEPIAFPSQWSVEPLANVVNQFKGRKPTVLTDFMTEGCQPYLTADYLRSGKPSQFAGASSLDRSVICSPEDPILIWDGSNAGDCFTGASGVLASTMVRCVPDVKKVRGDFLFYFLKNQFRVLNRSTTGSTIPHVNKNVFVNLQLPLPPFPEQRKIAAVLGVVQRAIEQQERLLQLTAELKKTLLQQLFTHGLRGETQKETDIGLVPESWDVVPLGSLAKVGNGSTPKRDNEGYWQGGTIPWLNSAKIHERFITEADQFVTDLAVKECHLPRVKLGSRGCPEFCVNGIRQCCGIRSPNWIVNRLSAAFQSLIGIVHFLLIFCWAR